jgi:hypothetical protein
MTDSPSSDDPQEQYDDGRFLFETTEKIRQFEISLVWQRALYFWGFITISFGGYAALKSSSSFHNPILPTLVACFGLVCAVGWTLSNRGSKFWFHVWEHKAEQAAERVFGKNVWPRVDKDENNSEGISVKYPMRFYSVSKNLKEVIKKDDGLKGFWVWRYSVSKLSIMISDFVVLLWLLILAIEVTGTDSPSKSQWIVIALTIAYVIFVFSAGRGNDSGPEQLLARTEGQTKE